MIGSLISHYRITGALGHGGMGVVYQAEDINLGRFVALKFLPAEFAQDAHTRARFHREARAASALNHPNICTIYEIAEEGGKAFIAMEYLEGASLRQLVEAGPLPLNRLLDIAIDICMGLEAAHRKGIVHRDIKPANILVTASGTAKILDFGLAKLLPITAAAAGPGSEAGASIGAGTFSTGSTLLGTVQYMSPEQVLGKPTDARSDLFSFGVLLYEMATGSLPFRGDSSPAILVAILHEAPVAPLRLNPNLPKALARIVTRCLEKPTEQRYQHAEDLRADLQELKQHSSLQRPSRTLRIGRALDRLTSRLSIGRVTSIANPSQGTRSEVHQLHRAHTRAAVVVSAGVILLTVLIFGLFHYRVVGTAGGLAERDKPLAPLIVRPLARLPGRKQHPIFSPDGNTVAFGWDGGDESRNPDVYLMQLDGGRPIQITNHPAGEWPQVFSPDGRRLYFTRQTEGNYASYWVPAFGGEETRVAEGIVTDISADGRLAALARPAGSLGESGAFVLDLATGAERRLANYFGAMDPKFTGDGRGVFVQDGTDRDHLSLYRVSLAGGKPEAVQFRGLGADVDRVETVQMAQRRGRMVIGARAKGTRALISFIANADGSEPRRLPSSVPTGALSPDGRQMIGAGKTYDVKVYRVEAFPPQRHPPIPQKVLDTANEEYSPKMSPDGKHFLLSSWNRGHYQIWLWNSDFTDGRPVFGREGGTAGSPAWSADGKWVAFDARTRSASADIWLMPASGGEPRIVVGGQEDNITPCFHPAGEWLYFSSSRTGSLQLFRVRLTGGPATQVTQGGGFTCQFSGDGRYVYYLKTRSGGEIWRLDTATNREEPVVPEMKSRNWKVLKNGIYMLDSQTNSQHGTAARAGEARFYFFATRIIQNLGFRTPKAADLSGIDISPDERWLYYSQVDSVTNELIIAENLP
jgi:serine/threonine protein kinase/Tol biopolymer transport system component